MYENLVSTGQLAVHIDDPQWVVCDCRFKLSEPDAGQTAYRESHIPGAVYFHLDRDLSNPITPTSGRHPLPDVGRLAGKLGRAGISAGTHVVVYDDAGGAIAARLWWLLRWLGHKEVAILDGGWQKWRAENHPVTSEIRNPVSQDFSPHPDDSLLLDSNAVLETVKGTRAGKIVDARAADRFQGRNETLDPVAGHVPGAVNLPFAGNLAADGRFKSATDLRRQLEALLQDTPPDQVICMCGSGVTACHNLLAMEVAGLKGARLFAGSWSEWIRDTSRPVATGT